jgi:hypothetical protein
MQDGSHAGRPWRGPLPPVRVSQARSLGDIWVTDRRSGAGGERARFAELLEEVVGRRAPAAMPETMRTKKIFQDLDSISKCTVVVPVRLTGPASWAVSGCGRPGRWFHGLQGLGVLFGQGGGRFSSYSPVRGSCGCRPRACGAASPPRKESPAPPPRSWAWGRAAPHPHGFPAAWSDMATRQWPRVGFGPRGGCGLGRPPAGDREVQRRAGPVHGSGD